jgi:epoxyqueuosine reductase QueG
MDNIATVSRLVPLMTDKMLERFNTLPFVPKSAFVKAFPFFTGDTAGNIALFARVQKYGEVVYTYMLDYERKLSEQYPDMKFLALKHGWPLPIVAAANMCGVGFTGQNGLQIVVPFGSHVALSAVVCDTLMPETPPEGRCLSCGECGRACPTKAMYFDGEKRILDSSRCIARLTQSKDEAKLDLLKLSPYIWGCDICQSVCPHNIGARVTDIPEFTRNIISGIDIDALGGDLSDRHYSKALDLLERNLRFVI